MEETQTVVLVMVGSRAAKEENKMEYAEVAEKLMLHAQTEEDVLYPTAILIGEYLKLKLTQSSVARRQRVVY